MLKSNEQNVNSLQYKTSRDRPSNDNLGELMGNLHKGLGELSQ
jgi:hypothetical protein